LPWRYEALAVNDYSPADKRHKQVSMKQKPVSKIRQCRWLFSFCLLALAGTAAPLHVQVAGTETAITSLDRYGGDLRVQRKATGYFRVEQIHRRWYFITPEGYPFIALGANHVGDYLEQQSASMSLRARYSDDAAATTGLLQSIRALGLNAGDAYQPIPAYARALPWIQPFEYLSQKGEFLDVFDPALRQRITDHVTAIARAAASNPWIIGLVGPDLPVWDATRVNRFRTAAPNSAGRQRYAAFLKQRHRGDIAQVNATYATKFASFAELEAAPQLTFTSQTAAAQAADAAFAALIAEQLFATTRAAVKAGAPHHLYLGERTQLRSVPDAVLKVMGKYADVFCTQAIIRVPRRPPEWQTFQPAAYDHEFALVNKPMIIVDWAAPFSLGAPFASDYGSIKAEAEAADDASRFLHEAFARPYLTGIFICQLIGTHPNDERFFGARARRSYLRPNGMNYDLRSARLKEANHALLQRLYAEARAKSSTR
jgi:hypothetical protein